MSRIENYVTENDDLTRVEELIEEGIADRELKIKNLSKQLSLWRRILMSRIENYVTENDALTRVEELIAEGVADRDITVLSQQPVNKHTFGNTDVNFRDSEGSAWDKFVSFFSPDEPEEK